MINEKAAIQHKAETTRELFGIIFSFF